MGERTSNGGYPKTCPGIRKLIRPVPELLTCPNCGGEVEMWSDEDIGTCDNCGKEVSRPQKETSCLDWCQYADQCREIIKGTKR
jgi:predicted amidophosphoribosyltransferase